MQGCTALHTVGIPLVITDPAVAGAHCPAFNSGTVNKFLHGALRGFYETYGHLYIPQGYEVDGHDVYGYFNRIRGRRKQLSDYARAKYESIGMDWEITTRWMTAFWAAAEYFTEYENLDVPSTLGPYHGVWLYPWLQRNRENKEKLCERQIAYLDSIGMDWEVRDYFTD